MRVTRSVLILAVTIAAAGCARQPDPWVGMAAAPAMATPSAPVMTTRPTPVMASGIDTMVYGSPNPPAPAPTPTAASDAGRGFFTSRAALTSPYVPAVAAPASPPAYAPGLAAYAATAPNGPYTLDSGDRLRIVVFGQDGLSNSYVVDASGYIAMPLIGTVLARGATTEQLSSRIANKLSQGYIKEPHVAVEIEAYRPFFILGEVTQPGQYPYVADMTVETAVAIAGGFGPRAYRKTVTIMRMMNGQQERLTVPTSFALRPGDTVNVQERWF
jgi:polysaccharide biosynthesis/export protein